MKILNCGNYSLGIIEYSPDVIEFIEELFSHEDIEKFFVLDDDDAADKNVFVHSMATYNTQNRAIDCIIINNQGQYIGLFTCELKRGQDDDIYWAIGYAIHPRYRRQSYATEVLKSYCNLLSKYPVDRIVLDISEDNIYSEKVAIKCGFNKMKAPTGGLMGYIDWKHPEIGMRFKWVRSAHELPKRDILSNKALDLARAKQYSEAIKLYLSALDEPEYSMSLWSNAQIYSNLGMCYSSIRQYQTAYNYLKKAQSLGLTNPSIEKELDWLHRNAGLG